MVQNWPVSPVILFVEIFVNLKIKEKLVKIQELSMKSNVWTVLPHVCWRDWSWIEVKNKRAQGNIRKKLPTSPIYKHLEETGHNATI